MHRLKVAMALTACCAGSCGAHHAHAHAIAGVRVFPITLTLDDPGVADEASLPTFTYQRLGADGDAGPTHQYNLGVEWFKTITPAFAIGVNAGYTIQSSDKTRTGFQDINVTLKYRAWVNAPHEAIVSLGVIREFGHTGTTHTGADVYGSTTPTVYFGKGMGDLPVELLRPVAVTGTFGYTVADRKLKSTGSPTDATISTPGGLTGIATQQFNNGYSNRWVGGVAVQYSMPYLRSQVRDYNLPEFVNRLIPIVEFAWSSPSGQPSNLGTQAVFAPGVLYDGGPFQLGAELLVPANRASGRNVGVIAQFHVFFDDLLPNSIGKPLFEY